MTKEEAVKMLRTMQRTVYLGNRKFEDAIECAIKALSEPLQPWEVLAAQSVLSQPEPRWIPCSEKPYPDTDGIYLITVRIGDSVFIEVSHFINMDGSVFWVDHDYNFGDVIAWMPAIEPYKGGWHNAKLD